MPVPLRNDGTLGPTRRLLVFVHGFVSSAKCWGSLLDGLYRDSAITEAFDIETFQYDTHLVHLSIGRGIPTISSLGAKLGAWLDNQMLGKDGRERYIDATLVGHSMGGLVIQSYLAQRLSAGCGLELDRVRQAIFFGTPNFGSSMLGTLRRIISVLFTNPQEEALRILSKDILHTIHHTIRDSLIDAHTRSAYTYPLPVYTFWGDSDDIVPEMSARGQFPFGEPLQGDHSSMLHPKPGTDDFHSITNAILFPHGHRNVWEIENFRYSAKVRPLAPGTVITATHGNCQRDVVTDNAAEVVREVRFGPHNNCTNPFILKYGTCREGWLNPNTPAFSVTTADKQRIYDTSGTEVLTEIEPKPNRVSRLQLEVYKGFDEGRRDYHMHLGQSCYYRHLQFEVNLQAYLEKGWRVTKAPQLYFHPDDPGDHKLCRDREALDPDPPHSYNEAGVWGWHLEFVKTGVVDIAWDLAPPNAIFAPESTSAISLEPGEHAIFGYGSLLSKASLERTLGRSYEGPFVVCDLMGWRRRWDVAMPNSVFTYCDASGHWVTPERIVYLNVAPAQDQRMNGVLFVLNDSDLKAFDSREWIYDRVQVNDSLRGVAVLNGPAWVYVAKPEFLCPVPLTPSQTAIRKTYLGLLEDGHKSLGPGFVDDYRHSTDSVPYQIVIDDHRRDPGI